MEKKENVCISYGTTYDLIKIRIISHSITKLLPSEHKTGQENILSICIDCNTESSKATEKYKKSIYNEYNINLNKTMELNKLFDYNTTTNYLNNSRKYFKKSLYNRIKQTYNIRTVTDDYIYKFTIDAKTILDSEEINYNDDMTNHILISKITDFNNINTNFLSESVKKYYSKIIES